MITAEEALASLPGRRPALYIQPLSETLRQFAEERQVYIYNVGPTMFIRYNGSLGTFVIPGKPEGVRYSAPKVIPGIVAPPLLVDEGKVSREQYDGMETAKDLVGNGAWRDQSDNLEQYGVFISRFNPPQEEEIEAAEERLAEHDSRLVEDGNRLYENSGGVDTKSGRSNIGKHHLEAAKRLGVTPKWARKAERLVECPACGESVKPNAAMCNHCDAVLDEAKARKFFPHKFAEEKRGPGRPKKEVEE